MAVLALLLAGVVALPPGAAAGSVRPLAAPAGLPQGVEDITATALGRALADQAATRYRALGSGRAGIDAITPAAALIVWRDPTGITIGPRSAPYGTATRQGPMGAAHVELVPLTVGRIGPVASATPVAATTAGWVAQASQCFTRISDGFSWLDHCYALYRLAGDNDDTRDWFALSHFATMRANVPWVMNAAQIGTTPFGPMVQAWADWQPRSDYRGACHQIVIAILSPVPAILDTATQCESWTIAKSSTAGEFAVTWDGRGQRSARELSMAIAVSVPQGGWPQWFLPASVSGSPF